MTDLPFLWGAATSAHQVEGQNLANDWWAWEQAGKVKECSGLACDHYRLFREDIALAARLGHTAHRFSLEWSRLEPKENQWDEEAFRHYEEVLKELRSHHIEPLVTLHHFTVPLWFHERGGWLSADAVHLFSRYVKKAVEVFGPCVRYWITLNEPTIFLYFGFYEGSWPPGVRSFSDSMKVFRHLLHAHLEAYHAIHNHYESVLRKPVAVSIAQHMTHFTPCRPNLPTDRISTFLRDRFVNHLFFEAALNGFLFFPGLFCERLPRARTLDFLGVNYYTRDFIRFAGLRDGKILGTACEKAHHKNEMGERNVMGWEVYPEGLYRTLRRLMKYHLPILITENGICAREDGQRTRFIRDHLAAVARAKAEGVPVFGYFYWSLLDNFEWAHGFEPRFGIVEVDYQNQARKVRESAQVLTECCRQLGGGG